MTAGHLLVVLTIASACLGRAEAGERLHTPSDFQHAFLSRYNSLRAHSTPAPLSPTNSPSYGIELVEVTEAGLSVAAAMSNELLLVNYSSALVIYDITAPGIPVRLAYLPIAENFFEIELDGTYAYLGGSEGLLTVVDFSDPTDPWIVSATRFGPDIHGMDIHEDLLFLAQGWNPSRIVDITNPASPTVVGTYDGAGSGGAVDVAYENDHLFVAGYAYGVRVFDVANPAAPVLVGSFPISGADTQGIVVKNGVAFTIGTFSGVLRAIDVSLPALPQQVGALTIGTHLWDIELGGQGLCVARQGDFDSSLELVNIANPASPSVVSSTDIEPIVSPYVIAASDDRVAVTSFDRFTSVFDVSNPGDPALRGVTESLGSVNGIASAGDWLAFQMDANGLLLVDRNDPSVRHRLDGNHSEVSSYFMASDGTHALISGCDYVWDPDQSGVSIVDLADPTNLVEVSFIPTLCSGDIVVDGPYAYFQDNDLTIVDWSNPAAPQVIGSVAAGGGRYIDLESPLAIVGGNTTTFAIVDFTAPASPATVSQTSFGWDVSDVAISNGYAFIAGRRLDEPTITNGLWVYDLANPASPVETGAIPVSAIPRTVTAEWPYAYLNAQDGLHMIDVSSPSSPSEVGFFDCGPLVDDVVVAPPYLYALSSGLMKLRADALVTDVRETTVPGLRLLSCYPNPFNPETVVRWSVGRPSRVSLSAYDVHGALVRVLEDRVMTPGDYFFTWDGRDQNGRRLASGVYFLRLSNGEQVATLKAVLLK